MVKILRSKEKTFLEKFRKLLTKRETSDNKVEKVVDDIINKIRKESDSALISLTKKFDNFNVKEFSQLQVQESELTNSLNNLDSKVLKALKTAIKRIKA